MSAILTIGARKNNAELMVDCQKLGYLEGLVFDATYGKGRFWRDVTFDWKIELMTNDLNRDRDTDYHVDFRKTGFPVGTFDTVVFDPPYKLNGTSTGTGPATSDDSYGVGGEYRSVDDKHMLIKDGIVECARISRRFLLVKCMDQVCSGRKYWQTHIFTRTAERVGFELVDMLHVQGYRKQPEGRRQEHAWADYSTLLVLERES
jgi:hypothetical protein